MTGQAVRWRRYGKDRLYVTAADGTQLGYRDLSTQQGHVSAPDRVMEFDAIVAAWTTPEPVPAAPPVRQAQTVPSQRAPVSPVTVAVEVEWDDLAGRSPGAMAREQAVALQQAAPVRTLVTRVMGMHTDERAWRIGADGEEKVAAQLAKLARKDPRWRFLHAVPVGNNGSDIDHVVIGPGGVLTLNAKHHPGAKVWVGGNTVMVNGQRQPYVRNSRHEAERATRLLTVACGFPVSVTGVVVPVGADDVTIKQAPADVHVVTRMRLARWLRARPVVLTDPQVEAIFAAARRSTTWQPGH
jgi:Nuclease-related domain